MEQNIKLLPQGINDFGRIRRENYYYVDKTMYLEKIEKDSSYMLLVRPRMVWQKSVCQYVAILLRYQGERQF